MNTLFISLSDIFQYWDILTQYVNPMTIILWAIAGGIIGFVIVLIVELILRKKILVKRRHWSLKILSYVYMVFLPLFAGYCFTQWFAIHACERELVKNIPTYLGDANSAFNKYLKDEVEKVVAERHLQLTGNQILDKSVALATSTVSEYLKDTDADTETKIQAYLMNTSFVRNQIVDRIVEKLGEKVMMDKELTEAVLDVKIQDLLNNGVLNIVLEKHIKKITGGLKANIVILFLISLLIPAIEIVIAHYLERKRLKRETDLIDPTGK